MPSKANNKIRCFAAIRPDNECLSNIERSLPPLKQLLSPLKIRWTPMRNWHLTLQFFGEVPINKLEGLCENLANSITKYSCFGIRFEHFNWFPSPSKPVVLACLTQNSIELAQLAGTVREAARCAGIYSRANKNFMGHLTVARPKQRKTIPIPESCLCHTSAWVESFGLYESRLTPKGAIYEEIANFPLPDKPI